MKQFKVYNSLSKSRKSAKNLQAGLRVLHFEILYRFLSAEVYQYITIANISNVLYIHQCLSFDNHIPEERK